jgi:hypothetical protein
MVSERISHCHSQGLWVGPGGPHGLHVGVDAVGGRAGDVEDDVRVDHLHIRLLVAGVVGDVVLDDGVVHSPRAPGRLDATEHRRGGFARFGH